MSIESVMQSNHLTPCHSLLLPHSIFPSIRVFSKESALDNRWPKYWSFSFKMCPHGRRSSTEWLLPVSLCPGWVQLPLASLGGYPRPAAASDPGSIQIIASAPDPGACEILYAAFKSGVYFPRPSGSPKIKPCRLQIQKFWEILFMWINTIPSAKIHKVLLHRIGMNLTNLTLTEKPRRNTDIFNTSIHITVSSCQH